MEVECAIRKSEGKRRWGGAIGGKWGVTESEDTRRGSNSRRENKGRWSWHAHFPACISRGRQCVFISSPLFSYCFPLFLFISFLFLYFISCFSFPFLLPFPDAPSHFFSVCHKHLRQYGGVIKPISFHPQVFISLIHPPCLRSVINKVSHHENEKWISSFGVEGEVREPSCSIHHPSLV